MSRSYISQSELVHSKEADFIRLTVPDLLGTDTSELTRCRSAERDQVFTDWFSVACNTKSRQSQPGVSIVVFVIDPRAYRLYIYAGFKSRGERERSRNVAGRSALIKRSGTALPFDLAYSVEGCHLEQRRDV